MKKNHITHIVCLTSFFLATGFLASCKPDVKVWTHYEANAPTEEKRGNVEFWADRKQVTLTKPTSGKIKEGGKPDYFTYSEFKELWIENELKITKGEDSFVIPLAEFPDLYYNSEISYSDAEYKVLKDVILEDEWTAIGTFEKPFKGVFNGNDKVISNLTIDSLDRYQGLFGYVSGGAFSNIKLNNVNISANAATGGVIGIICGGENVTLDNCHVLSGEIKSELFDIVGGIVGAIYEPTKNVTISNCTNSANVSTELEVGRAGGIIGNAGPTSTLLLENCTNSGVITSRNSAAMIGGTRGQAQGATFTLRNCKNLGTANVPYIGFFNSSANSQKYLTVVIENNATLAESLPTLFSVWQSGGTEGGYLSLTLNNEEYRYFLIPTYTYSVTQGKIVSLSPVNSVSKSLNQSVTTVTSSEWEAFLSLNPKAAIYNEDGSFKGVSPTTNCYAPNNYYIKGAQYGAFVNAWVKVI